MLYKSLAGHAIRSTG